MSKLREDLRRLYKYAVLAGMVLALVCPHLPEQYRALCDAALNLCSVER